VIVQIIINTWRVVGGLKKSTLLKEVGFWFHKQEGVEYAVISEYFARLTQVKVDKLSVDRLELDSNYKLFVLDSIDQIQ